MSQKPYAASAAAHFLLAAALSTMAGAVAAADTAFFDPWKLGASREELQAELAAHGADAPKSNGSIRIAHQPTAAGPADLRLDFFDGKHVSSVTALLYEGPDINAMEASTKAVCKLFAERYGGVETDNAKRELSSDMDCDPFVIEHAFDETPAAFEKTVAALKKEKGSERVVLTWTTDILPKQQPAGARVSAQVIYSSKTKNFRVAMYQDLSTSAHRNHRETIVVSQD